MCVWEVEVHKLKSVVERTPPCGTRFGSALGVCSVFKCCVCFSYHYVVSDSVGYSVSLSNNVLIVSNALLMSNATAMVVVFG